MTKRITFEEAKRLSILKWKYIHKECLSYQDFQMYGAEGLCREHPEFSIELHGPELCGLCGRYLLVDGGNCTDCPLKDTGENCCEEYNMWAISTDPIPIKHWSGKLLERIKNLKEK